MVLHSTDTNTDNVTFVCDRNLHVLKPASQVLVKLSVGTTLVWVPLII